MSTPFQTNDAITDIFRLTALQKTALSKLGIRTILDLLYYFPVRYGDTAEARTIDSLDQGQTAVVYGQISGLKTGKGWKSRIAMAQGYVEDETGRIHCVWFNQPYVAKMYSDGMLVRIEGKISQKRKKLKSIPRPLGGEVSPDATRGFEGESYSPKKDMDGQLYFSNPKIERVDKLPTGVGDSLFGEGNEKHTLYPVYAESRGITTLWLYHTIQKIFKSGILDTIDDPLPEAILKKYNLPGIRTALVWIHTPLNKDDARSARKRFAFEEIFIIQLGKQQERKKYESEPAFTIETDEKNVDEFVRRFPFTATSTQTRAINSILSDMSHGYPMSRLLEGDVGSGKTAVAAATAYAVIADKGLQVAYMCPTEILAMQHFESFIKYFSYMSVQIALITGSGCKKFPSKVNPKGWTDISRAQLLKWVADGSISVVIGTHALIQKSVVFKNLAYVIIDEQHRFGTSQRAKLVKKPAALSSSPYPLNPPPSPHLLSMTATPIPRTLALTMYGDLDLTILDESPSGRKQIITRLVLPSDRQAIYEEIRHELIAGRQMYAICPRIDEPDPEKEAAVIAKSVKEEAKRLKASVFPEFEVGVLHGKMTPKEKDSTMEQFNNGKIQILCATSVVEVGMNVPNATIIIIEGAERFGLAQLHQLRGRVMRSTHQSYCYAFTETNSVKSIERLKALQSAKNGFELAELDLMQRGAGQLGGAKQWGVSDIAMEALKNLKMVEAARTEAEILVDKEPLLDKYPTLKNKVEEQKRESHFE